LVHCTIKNIMANPMGMAPFLAFKNTTGQLLLPAKASSTITLGERVKHLQAKNARLEAHNARLEAQVAKLKAKLDTCENPVIYNSRVSPNFK
jgi:hypothetical protein